MNRPSRVACLAAFVVLLAVSTTAHAATQTCSYTFTSGSGVNYLKFCVTANGNIVQFESPAGVEQIFIPLSKGGPFEGYGICDESTDIAYYDYAYLDSGNWGAPTKVSQTATSVKIERTTSDGAWTLTQTTTSVPGVNPYAKVAMALKNNSGETKNVYLLRFAGFVPWDYASTGIFTENYDGTNESTSGYLPTGSSGHSLYFGLMLQNVGNAVPASALGNNVGFSQKGGAGPAPCKPFAFENSGTLVNGQGSGVYLYELAIKSSQTVTVTDRYMSF
jgi:hypothetical protein